jgi:hypothetical protein
MDKITELTIRSSLRSMFAKGWVDICAIKECVKLAGVTPVGSTMDHLHALHCVHFKDMDRELAEAIPGMVGALFEGVTLTVNDLFKPQRQLAQTELDITPPAQHPGRRNVLQLLGIKAVG